jgi:hypothetical protein
MKNFLIYAETSGCLVALASVAHARPAHDGAGAWFCDAKRRLRSDL